eukprot:684860-Pleurochrysis_carterae.AAC.1
MYIMPVIGTTHVSTFATEKVQTCITALHGGAISTGCMPTRDCVGSDQTCAQQSCNALGYKSLCKPCSRNSNMLWRLLTLQPGTTGKMSRVANSRMRASVLAGKRRIS